MSRKQVKLIEKPEDYTEEAMFQELNIILNRALQLGQLQVALNVSLVKARVSGIYDPLQSLPTGRVTNVANGQVEVCITDYKNITNRRGTPDDDCTDKDKLQSEKEDS